MSIGTKANDRDEPLYPQWGESRPTDTGDVDWMGLAQYSDAGTGGDSDTDAEAAADTIDSEEPQRDYGTPEPWGPDAGATTAEYAITTLAACGFAALLVVILKSEPIKELVTGVIETALGLGA